MEIKKTSKASLENKKSSWLLVGYVIVLVFMFVAFEWSKRDVRIDMSGAITENVFEQEIEIPITEQPELVAPPPPQAPAIAEVLTIVDDNDNVKETAIASSEEIGEAVIIKPISPTVDEEIPVEDEIFEVVEKNPEFSYNGMSLMQYLGKSIKYPTIAQETRNPGARNSTIRCQQRRQHRRCKSSKRRRSLSGQRSYPCDFHHAQMETR